MISNIETKAGDFVTTELQPAIRDAEDGGRALLRVVVEHVFHRAAQMDSDTGMNNVSELLDLAALAAEWGKHTNRPLSTAGSKTWPYGQDEPSTLKPQPIRPRLVGTVQQKPLRAVE